MLKWKIKNRKGQDFHRFKIGSFVFLVCISTFLSVSCASLLPPERRVYPKNPIQLPEGMDIHRWMEFKKKQFPDHLQSHSPYGVVYKIRYFRQKKTNFGSFISCSAYIRQMQGNTIELIELGSLVNYSDYHKSVSRFNKGGDIGPMNETERTEILLPCIEEFLNQT